MNKIITIGREFGSGGRELGRRLSEKLGIAYYDQEIITEIAKRTSLSEQYVQSIVEHKPVFSFPIHIGTSFYPTTNWFLTRAWQFIRNNQLLLLKWQKGQVASL